MKKRWWLTLAVLTLMVVLFALPAQAKPKLNRKKASLFVGKTIKLKVKGTKKKAKWSSSNKTIATVSKKGVVKGIRPGKATIKAKVGKKSLKCIVTVKKVKEEYNHFLTFTENSITIKVGETRKIYVKTEGYSHSWKLSNGHISTSDGGWKGNTGIIKVYGESAGTTKITVYDDKKPSVRDTMSIKVIQPVTVSIYSSDKNVELAAGETEKINYSTNPSNSSVSWSSSNSNIATVDSSGTVKGVSRGTAVITAQTSSGLKDTCTVVVHDVAVSVPSLPISIGEYDYKGYIERRATISKVTFEKNYFSYSGTFSVKMFLTGTKTYDEDPSTSSSAKVGWKLYDSDNIVIESGTFYSDSVFVGESFKSYTYIGSDLREGDYRLELLNVS